MGQGIGTPTNSGGAIGNPLKADNLLQLLRDIVDIVITFGLPIAALFIIYAGFLFVTARGSEEKIKKAKETFLWAIIGSAILLGSWVIVTLIQNTIGILKP